MSDSNDDKPIMEFPCEFPIKAMGHATGSLHLTIVGIVRRHAPETDDSSLKSRPSSNGKYLSITITINAQSREQLDAIYLDLTACEQVLMAL
jgi:putative lipoic acid-binding regulatory protein